MLRKHFVRMVEFFHELIDYTICEGDQVRGRVTGIVEHDFNPLLVCEADAKEFLIPIQDAFIRKVDKQNKRVEVNLPEGYLDIYLP
jgi:16S rRNA processing protein RimM